MPDKFGQKSSGEEVGERDFEPQFLFRDISDSNTRDLADFAILRTCKSIDTDAQDILYAKATTFIYVMNLGTCAIYTTPPAKGATDRMMNVEFEVPIYRDEPTLENLIQVTQDLEKHRLYSRMQATCRPTLDRFAGTSIMRNSFRITLEIGSLMFNDPIGHLVESPLLQTLKKLVGFQREARELARKVRKVFEPDLGPAIEMPADYGMLIVAAEIEFEPRKFHIENLRAKATRLSRLADGLRKEANRTIDEIHRLESQDVRAKQQIVFEEQRPLRIYVFASKYISRHDYAREKRFNKGASARPEDFTETYVFSIPQRSQSWHTRIMLTFDTGLLFVTSTP